MNRAEFLAALAMRLEDLPSEERDEATKYYSEYLDEVGVDCEESAIEELGGAEKVSNIIRANCGLGPVRTAPQPTRAAPELTLDGPDYAQKPSSAANAAAEPAAPTGTQAQPSGDPAQAATGKEGAATYSTGNTQYPRSGPATYSANKQRPPYNEKNNRVLWIVLIICTFPIWIGLFGGLFGMFVGLFSAFIGLVFSGFAVLISGIVGAIGAATLFAVSPATALATIGLCLLVAGLGAMLGGGMLLASAKVFPALVRGIGSFFSWLRGKVGNRNA